MQTLLDTNGNSTGYRDTYVGDGYSSTFDYDLSWGMITYTYNDGTTTTVYDSNWAVTSSTVNTAALTEIRDANNNLTGYSTTNADGTMTMYNPARDVTGYSHSYDNGDGNTSVTTYDANWNFLRSETRDSQGVLLNSNADIRDAQGNITGHSNFDGITTTTYDANWNFVSSAVDTTSMAPILGADGVTIGYSKTVPDQFGSYSNTTTYDLQGAKIGSSSTQTNLDGSITITTKDANGNFLRTTTQDASGRLLDSTTDIRDAQGNITGSEVFHGTTIWVYDANMNLVSNPAAAITYSTPTFSESTMNNGSVRGFATISLTGDTFTGINGQTLTGAVVSNVPTGLTAVVTKASAITATLSFTGSAASHANVNDIGNLTVTLGNTAFTLGHAEVVMGATASNLAIDFADVDGTTVPPIMGGDTDDALPGTNLSDSIIGGEGSDTITGGGGQDSIDLSETTLSSDTVVINAGDSTTPLGDMVYGFDVSGTTSNDILDLPPATIAANTQVTGATGTIVGHSIANGLITFSGTANPLLVNTANWGDALNYLMTNIADGQTVATYIDIDGDGLYTGTDDQLAVFQGNVTADILVMLVGIQATALNNTAQVGSVTIA